jgi:hypothetical protein
MAKPYNGHKNRNYWNVSLWLFHDEGLYSLMREAVSSCRTKDDAARYILASLGSRQTPDGVPYTYSAVRAAIANWEK